MKKRKRVALLVETSLSSGREILRGAARFAHQSGDWEIFHVPHGLGEDISTFLSEWEGEGIIARIRNRENLDALAKFNLPVVDVFGLVPDSGLPLVHVDDEAISSLVAGYFQRREFRHFGFCGFAGENWSQRRLESFRESTQGDSFHPFEMIRGTGGSSAAERIRLEAWLRDLPKPVAIMVCTDQCGLGLLEACRSQGLPVPEQIAVVGVDNDVPLCEIGSPALTSVRAGHSQVGYEAARLLDHLISGLEAPCAPLLVPPSGIVSRGSSDVRAIKDAAVAIGVNFIHTHLASPITNNQIARSAGISRTVFQKRFLKEMGTTIRDYLVEKRITRARQLIAESDFTLADIAGRCGFRHQEYMGSVFKKHLGTTPGELRRNLGGSSSFE